MVVTLLLIAVVGVAAIDTASIIYTRIQMDAAAQAAASEGAAEFARTANVAAATQEAVREVRERDETAVVTRVDIDRLSGVVTVAVTKKASTLVVQRLDFAKRWGIVTATSSAAPARPGT